MKKFNKQYGDIITVENLLSAWEEFLVGKRRRNDMAVFQSRLMDNIHSLYGDLKEKTYVHGAYQAFNISDPKPRNIHKAAARDRLVHHLLYRELYRYFDSHFINDSYSCRVDKGTHRASQRFAEMTRQVSHNDYRSVWVLKCDIRKFFASIDHGILKDILNRYIEDQDLLWLFGQVIDSFETTGRPGIGLPLGNLTSQILVNVYMNEFDQYVKRNLKVKYYIRYADDFVLLSPDRKYLTRLLPQIQDYLCDNLKLELHPKKVFLSTLSGGVDFLGWSQFYDHRTIRTVTKRRMFKKLAQNRSPETEAAYRALLKHGNTYKISERAGLAEQDIITSFDKTSNSH